MLIIQIPGTITDITAPVPSLADPILNGANGGIKTLFDLSSASSWQKQASPLSNDIVYDLSGAGFGNLSVAQPSTITVTYAGGGFDFTGVNQVGDEIQAPANVLTSIKASANQYFLVCAWVKLPTSSNWNSSTSLAPLFTTTSTANGWAVEADLLTIAMSNNYGLTARRQTNGSTAVDNITISGTNTAAHQGKVAQIAFWRNASGQTLQITSSAGSTTSTITDTGNNSGDFSTKRPRWGVTTAYTLGNDLPNARTSWRLYRGYIEDLSASGRNPVSVLANDYSGSAARFS